MLRLRWQSVRNLSVKTPADRPLLRNASINSSFSLSPVREDELNEEEDSVQGGDGNKMTRSLSNSLVGENVHASYSAKKEKNRWKKRPLFNRRGVQAVFKTGTDAANLLVQEARRKDPYQGDFLDAIEDIVYDLAPVIEEDARKAWVFKRLMEPEYTSTFRVPWKDDLQNSRINRGILILFSGVQGNYNGDAVLSANVSHGLGRMFGWENNLRCALAASDADTEISNGLGGMMCGSDFDPEDMSENEIISFCSSFVKTIAPLVGNIASSCLMENGKYVGRKEIKYLKQAYERNFGAAATPLFGSSSFYPEYKGFGCVYFAEQCFNRQLGKSLKGSSCLISGSGLLSRNIALKLLDIGAIPKTLSDESGILFCKDGLTRETITSVGKFRAQNLPLSDFAKSTPGKDLHFFSGVNVFRQTDMEIDVVFASRGMGEMNVDDAEFLEEHEVEAVFECTHKGVTTNARILLQDRNVLFAPAKAVSAGQAVATHYCSLYEKEHGELPKKASLEAYVESRMKSIAEEISDTAEEYNIPGNLKAGANILSFLRVAQRETMQER